MSGRGSSSVGKRLIGNRDGVAAVEFAIIFPVLLLIFLASTALFNAYRTGHSVDRGTAAISDLMSRQNELSKDFLDKRIRASANQLISFNQTAPSLRVTSLIKENGAFRIDWTYPSRPDRGFVDVPLPIQDLPVVPDGDSVLLTETSMEQAMLFKVLGFETVDHRATVAVRPRFSRKIEGPK